MTPAQRRTLAELHQTGRTTATERTMNLLMEKGYIVIGQDGFDLTKRGLRIVEGRAGGNLPAVAKKDLRAHFKSRKPPKRAKARGATAAARKAMQADLADHFEQAAKKRETALKRILGPTGRASAVKIAKASGQPFTARDVADFRANGWQVVAAGSVAGRVGAGGVPGVVFGDDDFTFRNPDTLGPTGKARALVIVGPVTRDLVDELTAAGFDVSAAPKKLREAIHKNPGPNTDGRKIYAELVKAAKKRQAFNASELAARVDISVGRAEKALLDLERIGLAHVAGRDLFGECWAPGVPETGLFRNPTRSARSKAEKKAKDWYQREDLTTEARPIKGFKLPEAYVEVGRIVAIEYESDKYDGKKKVWRHEVTKPRELHVSTDGSTLVVLPGFKITKRGIEG